MKKATDKKIDHEYLHGRNNGLRIAGYEKPKWIFFCEVLLAQGYTLILYEARRTVSKYITVQREGHRPFKVRFSNHKPIHDRELAGDCDFFVGRTHTGVRNTQNALDAVYKHFGAITR